jgi:hypothetical protein
MESKIQKQNKYQSIHFFYSLRSVYDILSTYGVIFLQRMEAAIVCAAFNLQRRRLTISIDIFA